MKAHSYISMNPWRTLPRSCPQAIHEFGPFRTTRGEELWFYFDGHGFDLCIYVEVP